MISANVGLDIICTLAAHLGEDFPSLLVLLLLKERLKLPVKASLSGRLFADTADRTLHYLILAFSYTLHLVSRLTLFRA